MYQFKTILIIAAILVSAGCNKKESSSVSVNPDYIHFKGRAIHGDENGISAVSISLLGTETVIAQTGENGEFRFTLSDGKLADTLSSLRTRLGSITPSSFNLQFESTTEPSLLGISRSIPFEFRGEIDLGLVNLGFPASVNGKVTRLHNDGDFTPEQGVEVRIGSKSVLTGEQGDFSIDGLPPGNLQAYLLLEGVQPTSTEIILDPGEDLDLPYPLVILPQSEVTGWLSPLPAQDPGGVVARSHPYRRSFKVHASPLAKYIRFSHDQASFDNLESAIWMDVKDKIHYDFPNDGIHKLFFQFADEKKQSVSHVKILTAVTDIFQDSDGISVVNGFAPSINVQIDVDAPAAAAHMRLAEDPAAFDDTLPWQPVSYEANYQFKTLDGQTAPVVRQLYCQFKTAGNDGVKSALYQTTVEIDPFSELKDSVFSINDGATVSTTRHVQLKIDSPESAYEMRIFTDATGQATGGVHDNTYLSLDTPDQFIAASAKADYVFMLPGLKTLYLQFRDKSGILSRVYKQTILVNSTDLNTGGFTINNGDTTAVFRDLTIKLDPPEGATGFKIGESSEALSSAPYQRLRDEFLWRASQTGLRTIYVRYVDQENNETMAYAQTIYIDPFLLDPGSFLIINGPLTMYPALDLEIQPPLSAAEMKLSLASSGSQGHQCGSSSSGNNNNFFGGGGGSSNSDHGWIPVDTVGEVILNNPGPVTVCVQFRTSEGDKGSFLTQSTIYDPFPLGVGGVTINNDNATTIIRNVTLDIEIPPAAFNMRVGSTESELQYAQFIELDTTLDWTLPVYGDNVRDRNQRVFVQFQSVDGELSTVFSDGITLDLFPTANLVVVLNNGDATTNNSILQLTLDPPPGATGIQISESLGGLNSPGLLPETNMSYSLLDTSPGIKTIYVRYIADSGKQSAVFSSTIELIP